MNLLMKFAVLGISLMLSVWACANNNGNNSARCDHAKPKTFVIKIIAGNDRSKEPKVNKEKVKACYEDDIVFEGVDTEDFVILFEEGSPFEQNLRSSKGKAKGRVKVNPKDEPAEFKYFVIVPGYPALDPRIIITPR